MLALALAACGRIGFDVGGDAVATSDAGSEVTCIAGADCAVQISSASNFACARMSSGRVGCWGSGTLGDGTNQSAVPVWVTGIDDAIDLATGGDHTCVIRRGGTVACWGDNSSQQLGTVLPFSAIFPLELVGLPIATRITAREEATCAIDQLGQARCWGREPVDQNGTCGVSGFSSTVREPYPIDGWPDVVAIAQGKGHRCAIHSDGHVSCLGINHCGQLGDGASAYSSTPVSVVGGLQDARSVAASHDATCIVRASREVWCFGDNANEALGLPTPPVLSVPMHSAITGHARSVDLSYGSICAIPDDGGNVVCNGASSLVPPGGGPIPGTANGVAVVTGGLANYVLTADGNVLAWGFNGGGQLGDGTTTDRLLSASPVLFPL